MRERIDFIDIAKGLGILAVVIGHTCYPSGSLAKLIFLWHMPLFFCLSGYTFKPPQSFAPWIARRFNNLLVPYIVTIAISFGYWALFYRYVNHDLNTVETTLPQVMKSLAYGTGQVVSQLPDIAPVGPLWFLPCLFCANVIYLALHRWLGTGERTWMWIGVFVCTALGILSSRVLFLPWSLDIALVAQMFMAFGSYVVPMILASQAKQQVTWICVGLFALSYIGTTLSMNNRVYGEFAISVVGACSGIIIILLLARTLVQIRWLKDILSYLGRASLVIMCFHAVDGTWGHFETFVPYYSFLTDHWILHAVARVAASVLIYEVIRRTPFASLFAIPLIARGESPVGATVAGRSSIP